MNLRLPFAALLLSLLVLPAHAGSANARMEVSFVVHAACTVDAPGGGAPHVSCSDASLYRVAPAVAAAPAGGNAAWTVIF
ncbi:hypothetical protein IFT60_00140 [Massilia sp. CFBP 13721]|nr:hypothetical protein [Massilia sp. CFBP 13721]